MSYSSETDGVSSVGRRVDRSKLEAAARLILEAIGEDPCRDGLRETPRRFAGMWGELADDAPVRATTFPAEGTDQMVLVDGLRVWAVCEHHLLPFWCDLTVGYITRDRVLGLSKFARLARRVALGVQVQERLVQRVAQTIAEATGSPDVAVLGRGQHLCLLMRGARAPHTMTTSVMLGAFRTEASSRAEFLSLAGRITAS
jgi:GTP cyclohydrolase I